MPGTTKVPEKEKPSEPKPISKEITPEIKTVSTLSEDLKDKTPDLKKL